MGNLCFRAQEEPPQGAPDKPLKPQPEAWTPALVTSNSISVPNRECMLDQAPRSCAVDNAHGTGTASLCGFSVDDAHLKEAAQLQKTWALLTTMSMSPGELTADVQLLGPIGSGSSAVVYRGIYQGGESALKIIVTQGRNERLGTREALLSPHLRHPHVVSTYAVRGCQLTAEFIEEMATDVQITPSQSRSTLPSLPSQPSEDGLGNPRLIQHERQGWREVLARVGAAPNKHLLMLVQELCDAGSLGAAIRQGMFRPKPGVRTAALARRVLLRTATELCRGMVHIHTANVLHGDLKPANVLLARSRKDRRGFTVKVADFGLSKLLHTDNSRIDSSAGGTLAYMSPEAFDGMFSRASDVYAFGMVLYEMATGERPYEHLNPAQVMMGVSLGELRPDWSPADWPELAALGARCLAQQPEDRPSFRELAEELVRLEEGLREANKQVSADQFNFPGLGPPQASSRHFVYAASSSCGAALRGSSSLTPQTPPAGIHSAPGVPSGGVLSGGLGGISAPSAVAQAVACALSSNDGLDSIPEPRLTSATFRTATFSTAAAITVAGLPVGAPAKAMELSMAAEAAEAAAMKPAAVTCVATGCGSIMVAATAAVHAAQARAPSSMGSDADSGPHDQQQMQQLQQELRHVPGAREHGPNGQREGEMDTRVMADVSPWTAATAVRAEDVELQCATDPSPPPDR